MNYFIKLSIAFVILFSTFHLSAQVHRAALLYNLDETPIIGLNNITDETTLTAGSLTNEVTGMPQIIAGANAATGNAWDFEGTDAYITVASNSITQSLGDINLTEGISVGLWVNAVYNNNSFQRIAGLENVFDVLMTQSGGVGLVEFRIDGDVNNIRTTPTENVLNGTWHHLLMTLDYKENTDNFKLYHNGQLLLTQSLSITSSFNAPANKILKIGARHSGSHPYPGQLDDFIVFDEAIAAEEVSKIYELGAQAIYKKEATAGFSYNWGDYDPTEFGTKNITFNETGIINISHAPEIGIHPRVYFGPDEVPDIKNRLENTASGQEAFANIHAYTILLNLGYVSGGYNHNTNYGLDAQGNRRVDNAGKWDSSVFYQKLKDEDPTALDGTDLKRRYLLASCMALEAFECLLYAGETDPDTGLDYDIRAADLARAMAFWADLAIADPNVEPHGQNFNWFGGENMALCYDLNYNAMTPTQRDKVRTALVKIIPDSPRYGAQTAPYATTSNWVGLNTFELLTNLAIEGEPGYKPNMTKEYMRSYYNFLTYGWYESGTPYEGMGKNYQFASVLVAAAKRGYSLLGHPHVRTFGTQFLPAVTQPYGHSFISTDVWGGFGWDTEIGGYKFHPNDVVGLKWIFPNEAAIDFVWRNYIEKFYKLDSEDYVYQQIEPSSNGYHNHLLPAAIFALDYQSGDWATQNEAVLQSRSFIAPERGLAILRSGYEQDDMMVHFHCRQDLGGHTHGDRNNFTLSALGRVWVRYTFGSSFQETEYHSCLLVDDLGIKITNLEGRKARQPGTILNFEDEGEIAQVTGDATYAYSWEWHWQSRSPSEDHSYLGTDTWEPVMETWNDFRSVPGTEPYFETPFYDFDNWNYAGNLERIIKRPYNPMERVCRTAAMLRPENATPYLLIVDDVQKDANVHNYKWIAQMASDLTVESTDVNLDDNDYRADLILAEPNGNRKLLVRVLQNNGYDGTGAPASLLVEDSNINGNALMARLIVEADVVAPDFKIMMFPYTDGDLLPTTQWNAAKDELTVIFGAEEQKIAFEVIDGKTNISLIQAPLSTLALQLNATVQHQDILLNWTNPLQTSLEKYTIERSETGQDFKSIATVDKNNKNDDQFIDKNVEAGQLYYYRLQQISANERTYSNTASAQVAAPATIIKVMPQPFNNYFSIEFDLKETGKVQFKIQDAVGRKMLEAVEQRSMGQHTYGVDSKNWASGVYYLQMTVGEQVLGVVKLMKE